MNLNEIKDLNELMNKYFEECETLQIFPDEEDFEAIKDYWESHEV